MRESLWNTAGKAGSQVYFKKFAPNQGRTISHHFFLELTISPAWEIYIEKSLMIAVMGEHIIR